MIPSSFSLFLKDLVTEYSVENRFLKAVEGVDLKIKKGEVMGLAGESACGKSTLAYSILRLLPANGNVTKGEIYLNGTNLLNLTEEEFRKIRWTEISVIFQGAMNALNPCMVISDQISEAIRAHEEISKEEANARSVKLLTEVGISERFSRSFPHELSGGMKQRVMIAMALCCDPSFLIADEPTTALDLIAQRNVLQVMQTMQEQMNLSVLLISHDLSVIAQMADSCTIMYAGKVVESGNVDTIFTDAIHPYTKALISAFPDIRSTKKIEGISGDPPDMMNPPQGCRFHPRCKYSMDICKKEIPQLSEASKNQFVACHLIKR